MKEGEEDYLRAINELSSKEGVRSIDIAEKLNISRASVSEMLKKLAKKDLVKAKRYSRVFLTSKGKSLSEKIHEKHELIKSFMQKKLNIEEKDALKEAHKLEHAFSDDSVSIIKQILDGKIEAKKYLPDYVG